MSNPNIFILDRKLVDLGMFGAVADCVLMETRPKYGVVTVKWFANIDTGMNHCDDWGDTPEEAARRAIERRISSLKASLAELQLFMQAKDWNNVEENKPCK